MKFKQFKFEPLTSLSSKIKKFKNCRKNKRKMLACLDYFLYLCRVVKDLF